MVGAQIYRHFCSSEVLRESKFFPSSACEGTTKFVVRSGWSMVLSSSALSCLACTFQDTHTHDSCPPAYSDMTEFGTLVPWEQS